MNNLNNYIGKRVEYKYRPNLFHTGIVKSFEEENMTGNIYIKVMSEQTNMLTEIKINRITKIF